MTDRLIISEVAMDVLEEVAIESTLHSLFDAASLEYTTDNPVAVTNTKPGEDEEPRTYFVWLFHVATNPELTVADLAATGSHKKIDNVRGCTCPGFRFHRAPPASALRDSICHGLAQVGSANTSRRSATPIGPTALADPTRRGSTRSADASLVSE